MSYTRFAGRAISLGSLRSPALFRTPGKVVSATVIAGQFAVAVNRLAGGPKGHRAVDPFSQFGLDVVYFELDRDPVAMADQCAHAIKSCWSCAYSPVT